MSGEITLGGNLVINAKSAQYGELIWKKNIALETSSFTYTGSLVWDGLPTMAEELNKDNLVYNTLSNELEKFYAKALNLAWQQIDPAEMRAVADQAKKADKKGN
jgi:cation transport regulator ChaB